MLVKLTTSDEIYSKTNVAVDHINNVLAAVQEQRCAFLGIVYDPRCTTAPKASWIKGNTLFDGINEGKGTFGKLAHDDTLYTDCEMRPDLKVPASANNPGTWPLLHSLARQWRSVCSGEWKEFRSHAADSN